MAGPSGRTGPLPLPHFHHLWRLGRPATLVVSGYGGIGGLTSGANPLERLNKEIKRRTRTAQGVVTTSPLTRPR